MIACYGKLPLCGDFVTLGDVDGAFPVLREWLHASFGAALRRLPEGWDTAYRVAPMWRFVAGPGVFSVRAVCGVLCPSVDRAGRWFPVVVIGDEPDCKGWYAAVESLLLAVFSGQVGDIAGFVQGLERISAGERAEGAGEACPAVAMMGVLPGRTSVWWVPGHRGAGASNLIRQSLPCGADLVVMFGSVGGISAPADADWSRFERNGSAQPWIVNAEGRGALVLYGDQTPPIVALAQAASGALSPSAGLSALHALAQSLHADISRMADDLYASGALRVSHWGVAAICTQPDGVTVAMAGHLATRRWHADRSDSIMLAAPCAFVVVHDARDELHMQALGAPVLGCGAGTRHGADWLRLKGARLGIVDAACVLCCEEPRHAAAV